MRQKRVFREETCFFSWTWLRKLSFRVRKVTQGPAIFLPIFLQKQSNATLLCLPANRTQRFECNELVIEFTFFQVLIKRRFLKLRSHLLNLIAFTIFFLSFSFMQITRSLKNWIESIICWEFCRPMRRSDNSNFFRWRTHNQPNSRKLLQKNERSLVHVLRDHQLNATAVRQNGSKLVH